MVRGRVRREHAVARFRCRRAEPLHDRVAMLRLLSLHHRCARGVRSSGRAGGADGRARAERVSASAVVGAPTLDDKNVPRPMLTSLIGAAPVSRPPLPAAFSRSGEANAAAAQSTRPAWRCRGRGSVRCPTPSRGPWSSCRLQCSTQARASARRSAVRCDLTRPPRTVRCRRAVQRGRAHEPPRARGGAHPRITHGGQRCCGRGR
jgi:hypothetical protein